MSTWPGWTEVKRLAETDGQKLLLLTTTGDDRAVEVYELVAGMTLPGHVHCFLVPVTDEPPPALGFRVPTEPEQWTVVIGGKAEYEREPIASFYRDDRPRPTHVRMFLDEVKPVKQSLLTDEDRARKAAAAATPDPADRIPPPPGNAPPAHADAARLVMGLLIDGRYAEAAQFVEGDHPSDTDLRRETEAYPHRPITPPDTWYSNLDLVSEHDGNGAHTYHYWLPFWTEEEGRSDLTLIFDVVEQSGDVQLLVRSVRVP